MGRLSARSLLTLLAFLSIGSPVRQAVAEDSRWRLESVWSIDVDAVLPVAVTVDMLGRVYVLDQARARLKIHDADGQWVHSLGRSGSAADGRFLQPAGVTAGPGFHVVIADAGNGRVVRYLTDVEGSDYAFDRVILDRSGLAAGLFRPVAIGFDPGGGLAVVDSESHRVFVLDEFGRIEKTLSGFGDVPGRLQAPAGLAYDRRYGLFVADSKRGRIVSFDGFGNSRGDWPVDAAPLSEPRGVAVDRSGMVFVAESGAGLLTVLGTDGRIVARMPLSEKPVDLALGPEGDLYSVDVTTKTLQRMRVHRP